MAPRLAPVEVGTRGTIGSLLSQEIEYFRRLDLGHHKVSYHEQKKLTIDAASSSGNTTHNSGSDGTTPKKKRKKKNKKLSSGGFLTSICSAAEMANSGQTETIKGIRYRNLRTDGNKLPQD